MNQQKDLVTRVVDFLLLKPLHLVICFTMVSCAVELKRGAFVIHVFGVTFFLLVVLHKINMCYGKIENKFRYYEYIVLAGGVVHTFVPLVGLFFPVAMMVHIGICFSVHILHLMQCYQVFNDMKMKDNQYIFILWAVNIAEFLVNFAFAFPDIVSDDNFVICLTVVEVAALLISSLKLSSSRANTSAAAEAEEKETLEKIVQFCTSRVYLLFWTCLFVALLVAFHESFGFSCFIVGFTGLSLIAISKFQNLCREFPDAVFTAIQVESIVLPPLFAFLTDGSILHAYIGVPLVLLCSLPSCFLILRMGYIVLGMHTSYYVGILGLALFFAANIVRIVLRGSDSLVTELLECCTLATAMIFCLVENKARKVNKKDHSSYGIPGGKSSYYEPNTHPRGDNKIVPVSSDSDIEATGLLPVKSSGGGNVLTVADTETATDARVTNTGNSIKKFDDANV